MESDFQKQVTIVENKIADRKHEMSALTESLDAAWREFIATAEQFCTSWIEKEVRDTATYNDRRIEDQNRMEDLRKSLEQLIATIPGKVQAILCPHRRGNLANNITHASGPPLPESLHIEIQKTLFTSRNSILKDYGLSIPGGGWSPSEQMKSAFKKYSDLYCRAMKTEQQIEYAEQERSQLLATKRWDDATP